MYVTIRMRETEVQEQMEVLDEITKGDKQSINRKWRSAAKEIRYFYSELMTALRQPMYQSVIIELERADE